MPMWCSSSDAPRVPGTQPHHRIVRIPPGESVVLNSAERAPYLLLIEILNDDLDFDPARRSNKEVLKKIVLKEGERKGASRELITFGHSFRHHPKSNTIDDSDVARNGDSLNHRIPPRIIPSTPIPATLSAEEEEIDLVEQLYGTDQSLLSRPVDLSETIVLPPAPKNKELDMVAWSRSSSIPPSPALENGSLASHMSASLVNTPDLRSSPRMTPSSSRHHDSLTVGGENGYMLSLDEYSERMRTAAIMLAQLNANLVRESVTHVKPNSPDSISQSGPRTWLQGLTNSSPVQTATKGPVHPSLTGSFDHSHPAQSRMRLQYSEAAAIRDRIMKEMLSLEEERMERMRDNREGDGLINISDLSGGLKSPEDEGIIRRELNKADPSAVVFSESWAAKKVQGLHSFVLCH